VGCTEVLAPWRAGAEIIGFGLNVADGRKGRVSDFVLEEECGALVEIVVVLDDGKELLIPAAAVDHIDWAGQTVYATSEQLLEAQIELHSPGMSGVARQALSYAPD
jgi:hypothetical protein